MIIFFDTETTGLPINWKAPMSDLGNWPRVIQIAWAVCDFKGEVINQKQILILPDNWIVPNEPFWIEHGFTTEKSKKEGVPMRQALHEFILDLSQCEYLVSHNLSFDKNVLGAEMLRYEMNGKRCIGICTKEASTEFCAIPYASSKYKSYPGNKQNYKWPTLKELHNKLFGVDFDDAHSAGGDVAALKNCFFELVRLGVIEINQPA